MQKADVVTNVVTYSAAIGACERTVQWQQALGHLMAVLQKAAVVTKVITYSAAISACEKAM
jgi:hypothetical protein